MNILKNLKNKFYKKQQVDENSLVILKLINYIDKNFDSNYCSIDGYECEDIYEYQLNINFDIESDPFHEDYFETYIIRIFVRDKPFLRKSYCIYINSVRILIPVHIIIKFKELLRKKLYEHKEQQNIQKLKNTLSTLEKNLNL